MEAQIEVKPDDLIPPDSELAQLLLQWSEDTDSRTWNIANLTNELIEEFTGGPVTRAHVYIAVAKRCKGQKPNTIRRWAEVAADYPLDVQAKYAQLLSFQHFKTARRLFKENRTPYIEYALEWCVSGDDDKLTAGRFHTVGEMIANFVPQDEFVLPAKKTWEKVKDTLYDSFILVDNDFYRTRLVEGWKDIDYLIGEAEKAEAALTKE